MLLSSLAWRNIWRHPLRSLLTILGMTIASGVVFFFFGIQLKSYDSMIEASTSLITGEFQIQHPSYLKDPDIDNGISEDLFEKVRRSISYEVTRRAEGFGLVASSSRTVGIQVLGIDPELEAKVTTLTKFVIDGTLFKDSTAQEIIIGDSLARVLGVKVGDELTVLGQGSGGTSVAFVLPVTAIFRTNSAEIDRNIALLPLKTFQEQYYFDGRIHRIIGQLESGDNIDDAQKSISRIVSSVSSEQASVLRWDQIIPGIREMIDLDVLFGWMFYASLIVISVIGLVNTISMSVVEREPEFGILRSLGVRKAGVLKLVLLESFFLSLVGVMLGVAIGSALLIYFYYEGFSVPGMEEVAKKWNLPPQIHPEIVFGCFIGPAVIAILGLLGCSVPALRASRKPPLAAVQRR